jgi:hypothetical protein
MKAGRCCAIWASRSGRTEKEETHGQNSASSQAGSQTEVPRTRLHPVPAMRQAQGGLSQVRPLPDLPARNGAPGRATRHHEVVVVMRDSSPFFDVVSRTTARPSQATAGGQAHPRPAKQRRRTAKRASPDHLMLVARGPKKTDGTGPVTETAPRRKHSNS